MAAPHHLTIEMADDDMISDDGAEIYSLFRKKRIRNMPIPGVHPNFCISRQCRLTGIR